MNLRTELTPTLLENPISIDASILLAGSCFAGHIGEKLNRYRFNTQVNPFGVIFNPVSLCNNLKNCIEDNIPSEELYIQSQEVWYHYQLHTDFAALEISDLKNKVKNQWKKTRDFLNNTNYLILTFGTAWVYKLHSNSQVVANCHKIPAKKFKKELLSVEEIKNSFKELIQVLPKETEIILTVSPVRHLKDTLELNSVSKSTLRLACYELTHQFQNVHYFPSYELLIDDLRDYRFFREDMLHPTPQAVNYVWNKFMQSSISTNSIEFIQRFEKILLQVEHKPHMSKTEAHQKFLKKLLNQLQSIKDVKVDDLIKDVKERLISCS